MRKVMGLFGLFNCISLSPCHDFCQNIGFFADVSCLNLYPSQWDVLDFGFVAYSQSQAKATVGLKSGMLAGEFPRWARMAVWARQEDRRPIFLACFFLLGFFLRKAKLNSQWVVLLAPANAQALIRS